jgi:hypothetical protein
MLLSTAVDWKMRSCTSRRSLQPLSRARRLESWRDKTCRSAGHRGAAGRAATMSRLLEQLLYLPALTTASRHRSGLTSLRGWIAATSRQQLQCARATARRTLTVWILRSSSDGHADTRIDRAQRTEHGLVSSEKLHAPGSSSTPPNISASPSSRATLHGPDRRRAPTCRRGDEQTRTVSQPSKQAIDLAVRAGQARVRSIQRYKGLGEMNPEPAVGDHDQSADATAACRCASRTPWRLTRSSPH